MNKIVMVKGGKGNQMNIYFETERLLFRSWIKEDEAIFIAIDFYKFMDLKSEMMYMIYNLTI